jgi:hypothetical protein
MILQKIRTALYDAIARLGCGLGGIDYKEFKNTLP